MYSPSENRSTGSRLATMPPFARGLLASLSIGIGYLPIAFSFGLAALQANLPPLTAVLISGIMFAGASQFALIALVTGGGSLLTVIFTILLMNFRHIFYGPSIMAKLRNGQPSLPPPLLAFGLTDEVFASAIGKLPPIAPADREWWYVGLQLGAYSTWVIGTALGAILGQEITSHSSFLSGALNFVLPALFLSLLFEIGHNTKPRVLLTSTLATACAIQFMPAYLAMMVGMLVGAASSYRRLSQ